MSFLKKLITAATTCALIAIPNQVLAERVSMELVLSVDSSSSISNDEYELQRTGYADAFRSEEVISSIENLPLGLAVTIELWTSETDSSLGWYLLKTRAEILAFADVIDNLNRLNSSGTDIDLGLRTAVNSLLTNEYEGQALVIDISGDGVSYATDGCDVEIICPTLQDTRDDAVNQGIIINGLPIISSNADTSFLEDRIDEHYEVNVIGGDGSFIEVANGFENFATAAQNKIFREITENTPIIFAD